MLSPLMQNFAAECGWAFGGFWRYGVCNDSVELLLRASMDCEAGAWPLFNRPEALKSFAAALKRDSCSYTEALQRTLISMPSDVDGDTELAVARRILSSWPWTPGSEPFSSATMAHEALQELVSLG